MLQYFKKLKLCTKLVPRQYMKIFTSKFICNNLCLVFGSFIIYLQSSTNKVYSTSGTLHRMTGSSGKLITRLTFVGKCPWLMYMIWLTYCFPFFSAITTPFGVSSCFFKLKDFNCSNSFVHLPFFKFGH